MEVKEFRDQMKDLHREITRNVDKLNKIETLSETVTTIRSEFKQEIHSVEKKQVEKIQKIVKEERK